MENSSEQKGKLYYSISEVAKMFNVNASLLRFWEKEFDLQLKKNGKGNRQYTQSDLKKIELIHHLVKEKGMTLQGAKNHMDKNPDSLGRDQEVVSVLKELRTFLVNVRKELDQ